MFDLLRELTLNQTLIWRHGHLSAGILNVTEELP